MSMRNAAFMAVLILIWAPGIAIIAYSLDFAALGNALKGDLVAIAIVVSGPIIAKDASLIGEMTPFAAAAALVLLAPRKQETKIVIGSIGICIIGWLVYLTLSVLLNKGTRSFDALSTVVEGATGSAGDIVILQAFATGTRVLYLVVAASLVGLKIRRDQ